MDKLGFLLLIIGCAGIESENMIIPAVMVLSGLAFIGISLLKEKVLRSTDQSNA